MPPSTNPPFSLHPLTPPAIPTCAQIAAIAFTTDRQTQFKAADPSNPYDHAAGTQAGLEHWLGRPPGSIEVTVAVDDATQEILGWVAWGFRGFGSEEEGGTVELDVEGVRGDAPPPEPDFLDRAKVPREQLDAYTSYDLQTRFMETLMPPGVKCMFVASIVVHPAHHGRGVGTALIRQGTDRADGEGVCCWIHASEAGAGMFEKCGFEEIRRLEVDLDEWNWRGLVPPEGEGARWGRYVFRYMLRQPVKR